MPHEPKYQKDDFLFIIDNTKPTNIFYISHTTGCSRDVAKLNLLQLEIAGKVKELETLGEKESPWVKI